MIGIKIVNIIDNQVVKVIGLGESTDRFLYIALYQGVPKIDAQYLLTKNNSSEAISRTADQLHSELENDPNLFVTR